MILFDSNFFITELNTENNVLSEQNQPYNFVTGVINEKSNL